MIFGEEFYLPGAKVPQVFLDADRQTAELHKNDPRVITTPKRVPMPFIEGCKGAKGPIIVTEDWYVKQEKKRLAKKAQEKRDMQIEMMQLISHKDRLKFKLGELDPSKKSDAKKIIAINIKIKDIEAELKVLQEQSGINLNELDHGSRLGRYVGHFKRFVRKTAKKVKRFYKRNRELIYGIAAIVLPVILTGLSNLLLRVIM